MQGWPVRLFSWLGWPCLYYKVIWKMCAFTPIKIAIFATLHCTLYYFFYFSTVQLSPMPRNILQRARWVRVGRRFTALQKVTHLWQLHVFLTELKKKFCPRYTLNTFFVRMRCDCWSGYNGSACENTACLGCEQVQQKFNLIFSKNSEINSNYQEASTREGPGSIAFTGSEINLNMFSQ